MKSEEFQQLALMEAESIRSSHMGQIDFRVNKKIFATLDPDADVGTLKLTADQQLMLLELDKSSYKANGSWGDRGWTKIKLADASPENIAPYMHLAWTNVAPKRLQKET